MREKNNHVQSNLCRRNGRPNLETRVFLTSFAKPTIRDSTRIQSSWLSNLRRNFPPTDICNGHQTEMGAKRRAWWRQPICLFVFFYCFPRRSSGTSFSKQPKTSGESCTFHCIFCTSPRETREQWLFLTFSDWNQFMRIHFNILPVSFALINGSRLTPFGGKLLL